jgi:hypothetical protein
MYPGLIYVERSARDQLLQLFTIIRGRHTVRPQKKASRDAYPIEVRTVEHVDNMVRLGGVRVRLSLRKHTLARRAREEIGHAKSLSHGPYLV